MGITGSLPLRWSTPAVSGVEMGSSDSKVVGTYSEHPQLVPSVPIPNHSRVSSSVTTTTLIGSSPLKSLGCRTESSCIISSKHVNRRIRRSIDSGVTRLGLKRSRDSNTSNVSIPVKRRRGSKSGPEFTQSSANYHSNVLAPSVRISKAVPSKVTNVDQRPETPKNPPQSPRSAISNVKHCLVTNELASKARVEPCYLLNQRLWKSTELLTRLEWMWGMQYNSLKLDTEANRIYLRHDLLESFDSNRWLLLPSPEMVNKIWNHYMTFVDDSTNSKQHPHIETLYEGAETFEYRLLPLRRGFESIDRFNEPDLIGTLSPAAEQNPTHHLNPFDTFPTLVSHVKPHFVICDSAAKLTHENIMGSSGLSQVIQLLWPVSECDATCILVNLQSVYSIWLEDAPPLTFASSPRTPLRLPSSDACPTLPIRRRLSPESCVRPCINSRFAWTPLPCSRCQNGGIINDSTDSDSDEDLISLSPSEAASEYKAYRRHLSYKVRSWQSRCMKEGGRWTSRVFNDDQLGSYVEERSRNIRRTIPVGNLPVESLSDKAC